MFRQKLLSMFVLIFLTLISACSVQAGNPDDQPTKNPPHDHTYSSDWKSDDSYHWHEATCGHKNETSGKELHQWDEGTLSKEETVDNPPESTFVCEICDKTKIEIMPREEYKIIYHNADGLENPNTATYTIADSISLVDLEKEHNNFDGWYLDSKFTSANKINGWTPNEKTGDIDLYAKFTPTEYLVKWDKPLCPKDGYEGDYIDRDTLYNVNGSHQYWKRITYTSPDGETKHANPYEANPDGFYVKSNTYIYFEMYEPYNPVYIHFRGENGFFDFQCASVYKLASYRFSVKKSISLIGSTVTHDWELTFKYID